jgi:hypothetical protein
VDDIVTRLRDLLDGPVPMIIERADVRAAADEIERLRKALHEARMQTALWRALCEEVQAELHDTVERSYRIEDERG